MVRRGENWRTVEKERAGRRGAVREEGRRRIRGLLTIDISSTNAGRSSITGKKAAESSYNSCAMHERTRYLLRPTHF